MMSEQTSDLEGTIENGILVIFYIDISCQI
jgi:hypothetical protein